MVMVIVETGIFWDNYVNTMAADALASEIAKSSTIMVMTIYDKQARVFHVERFELPVPYQCWDFIANGNILCSPKISNTKFCNNL